MEHPNIGKIFLDKPYADKKHGGICTYAVGRDGFLDLRTGYFITYGSGFEGPEYFDQDAFVEVKPIVL